MKRTQQTLFLLLSSVLLTQCQIDAKHGVVDGHQEIQAGGAATIKIIAFNDFHGQLESPGDFPAAPVGPANVPVGGAEWMAGYLEHLKAQNPHSIVVSAGDLIGASPPVSALFHDEGTIETMNRLGLDFNAVGNHEFDDGKYELLRMQSGGCHPHDIHSCRGAEVGTPVPFEGARFKFLAANVVDTETGKTLFPAYAIKTLNGVRIAFIGMTLKETPAVVNPAGLRGLQFKDEVETVNALIPELQQQHVDAIVLLIHQGGVVRGMQSAAMINLCEGNLEVDSPIKAIVNQLDDAVDLVVSGHTHQAYNCRIANREGRLISVTSANAKGRVLTDIDLVVEAGAVAEVRAQNLVVDRHNGAITPHAGIKAIVDNYQAIASPVINRVIGRISASISRNANEAGESALGDLVADAELAATKDSRNGGAVIAFINYGDIRADLAYLSSSAHEGDGYVTYGEAYAIQPFGNSLVTMTLTGTQLHTLLEQQFTGCTEGYPIGAASNGQSLNRIMQVSEGFRYTWQEKGTPCDNVDPSSMTLNGMPIDPAADYRITVNSFMADGGDQFYVLMHGRDQRGGPQELDALERYFRAHPIVVPSKQDRILRRP